MARLAGLLLWRGVARVLLLSGLLAIIGAVVAVFAWISPSLRASELAVWQRLDPTLAVSTAAEQTGDCIAIYTFAAATTSSPDGPWGHPSVLVGSEAALALVGLPQPAGSAAFAFDDLAAIEAGVSQGDHVVLQLKGEEMAGEASVIHAPVQLTRRQTGSVAIVRPTAFAAAIQSYGSADEWLCVGDAGVTTAGEVRATIERRQADQGLVAATAAFAALASTAWTAALLVAAFATSRRRSLIVSVLDGLGVSRHAGAAMALSEVIAAGILGLAAALVTAAELRTNVLRTWTDPTVIISTAGGLGGLLIVAASAMTLLAARRQP